VTDPVSMDILGILRQLPHRYPFLAQAAGILAFVTAGVIPDDKTQFYFVSIDKARFRRPVLPGDQLVLTARLERIIKGLWKFSAVAYVGEEEATSCEMMVAPATQPAGGQDK
jgi:3-hydroxyacyl-[acyl-carrier-protein] dehydratase